MLNLKYLLVVFVAFVAFLIIENGDVGVESQSTRIISEDEFKEYQRLKENEPKLIQQIEITKCYTLFRNGFQLFDKKYCIPCLKRKFPKLESIADNLTYFTFYSSIRKPCKTWKLTSVVFDCVNQWSDDESAIQRRNKLHMTCDEMLKYSNLYNKLSINILPQDVRITAIILWLVKTDEWRDDPRAKHLNNERLRYLADEFRRLHFEKNYTIIEISQGVMQAWRGACNLARFRAPRLVTDLEVVQKAFVEWYSKDSEKSSRCARIIVEAMKTYPSEPEEYEEFL